MMAMPDVQAEIAATKAALAGLRASLERVAPQPVKISVRTEHILRLGQIFLAAHNAKSFSAALGFTRIRTYGPMGTRHPDYRPKSDAHRQASRVNFDWSVYKKRPPVNPTDKTYRQFTEFFSQHWPDDLAWPADIPRPPKSNKEAA